MNVFSAGAFDELDAAQVRFTQEAARLGPLTLLLLSDRMVREQLGREPKFPQEERRYFWDAMRYPSRVEILDQPLGASPAGSPPHHTARDRANTVWVVREGDPHPAQHLGYAQEDWQVQVIPERALSNFPQLPLPPLPHDGRKTVIITGSFDWLHTGHVRFFEEVAQLGHLIAVVGHDANIRLLKGEGHPLYPQDERLYMVRSVRFVSEAVLSTGHGWLDAEPQLEQYQPDLYAVNEDGDKPEKRAYCEAHGIEYVVLKRKPKEGLPGRSSTDLRGY